MNVTKDNFLEILPELTRQIETATYMAVDFEMTGLFLPEDKQYFVDSVEERYYRMRAGIEAGLRTLQFGLTLSHYNPDTQSITHTPYNIYTWPTKANLLEPSVIINQPHVLLDVDSIEFNRSHNMNFSEWINSGVSLVQREQCGVIDASCERSFKREESYLVNTELADHKAALGKAISTKTFNEYERSLIQHYTVLTMQWIAAQLLEKNALNQEEHDEFVQQASNTPTRRGGRGRFGRGKWKKNNKKDAAGKPTEVGTDGATDSNKTQDDDTTADKETNTQQDDEEQQPTVEEPKERGPLVTSWMESQTFEVPDDTLDNRNLLLIEIELSLWKFCRKYNLVARTTAFKNPETGKRGITLTLYTHDHYQIYLEGVKKEIEAKRITMYGGTYVWHLMTNSLISRNTDNSSQRFGAASPLLVHNGFFDLMFLYNHCEGPLPKTFAEMSRELSKFFPAGIYDTKFIFGHPQTQAMSGFEHTKGISNSLGGLYLWFTKQQAKQQDDLLKLTEKKDKNNDTLDVAPESSTPAGDAAPAPVEAENKKVEAEDKKEEEQTSDVAEQPTAAQDSTEATPVPAPEEKKRAHYTPSKKYQSRRDKPKPNPFPSLFLAHDLRPGFESYSTDQDRCHEAGYDSWLTAVLFGHLMIFCGSDPFFQTQLKLDGTVDPTPTSDDLSQSTNLEQPPTPLSTTNIINRLLNLPLFSTIYRNHTNSFGQYVGFNFGYLGPFNAQVPATPKTNYFLSSNDRFTPREKRADSFVVTIKMQQFADRLIKDKVMQPFPPQWNKYVAIPGVYPSDLSLSASKYFVKYLQFLELLEPHADSGAPYIDFTKQIHLPLDRNNKDAVFYCRIMHNRALLTMLDTSQPGNCLSAPEFTQHLFKAFKTPQDPKEGDEERENFLTHITLDDFIVEPYSTFLAKRDLEHLYQIGETPEGPDSYPLFALSPQDQEQIHHSFHPQQQKPKQSEPKQSSSQDSSGGTLNFLLGLAVGAVAAAACGAAVFLQPKKQ